METRIPVRLQKIAVKMAKIERTEYKTVRRPRYKEYSLVKYNGKKVVSREKIWLDESKLFPSDDDFFWESDSDKKIKKVA